MMRRQRLLFLALPLLLVACADSAPEAPATSPGDGGTLSKEGATRPPAGAPPAARKTSLSFTAPEGWIEGKPTNPMRKAQFVLPRQGADEHDAELVLFYFGAGQGGSIDLNVQRWASQFRLEDGGDPAAALTRTEREVNGMAVTEVALDGTYAAETMPGSGERLDQPGSRLFGAILESDHGPYFVKLVGPEATVRHWEDSVRAYVGSAE